MDAIEQVVRNIVREELAGLETSAISGDPVLISVDEAAKICGDCDKSVIHNLVRERETNDFPAVVLGPRTIKIDKRRLDQWFARGGLKDLGVKA